jgi:competence ComEA-like helix-hairpin-helix protein
MMKAAKTGRGAKAAKGEAAKGEQGAKGAKHEPRAAQVDVNAATVDQLKGVRGLGNTRALEIVRYRDRHGPFKDLSELERVPHMGDMPWGELDEVKTHLTLHLEGEAAPSIAPDRVDVNHANIEELRGIEGIGADRAQEIVEYREQHGGIRDINELDALPHFRDEPEGQRAPIKARLRV